MTKLSGIFFVAFVMSIYLNLDIEVWICEKYSGVLNVWFVKVWALGIDHCGQTGATLK